MNRQSDSQKDNTVSLRLSELDDNFANQTYHSIIVQVAADVISLQKEIVTLKEDHISKAEADEKKFEEFLQGVFELIDLCDRLLEHEQHAGIKRLLRKIERLLSENGIEEIQTQTLDPFCCRVIETACESNYPNGAILRVVRRGFKNAKKVLRLQDVITNKIF